MAKKMCGLDIVVVGKKNITKSKTQHRILILKKLNFYSEMLL